VFISIILCYIMNGLHLALILTAQLVANGQVSRVLYELRVGSKLSQSAQSAGQSGVLSAQVTWNGTVGDYTPVCGNNFTSASANAMCRSIGAMRAKSTELISWSDAHTSEIVSVTCASGSCTGTYAPGTCPDGSAIAIDCTQTTAGFVRTFDASVLPEERAIPTAPVAGLARGIGLAYSASHSNYRYLHDDGDFETDRNITN